MVGIAGGYREEIGSTEVHLVSMWTAPEVRRTGLGRLLVGAVIDWAADTGASSVGLWVTRGNAPAQLLYESMGFRETGEHQPLPSDPCADEVRMILHLELRPLPRSAMSLDATCPRPDSSPVVPDPTLRAGLRCDSENDALRGAVDTYSAGMDAVNRPEDDELCGFVDDRRDGWHALTVFGASLGVHPTRLDAEEHVLNEGLASLMERWILTDRRRVDRGDRLHPGSAPGRDHRRARLLRAAGRSDDAHRPNRTRRRPLDVAPGPLTSTTRAGPTRDPARTGPLRIGARGTV